MSKQHNLLRNTLFVIIGLFILTGIIIDGFDALYQGFRLQLVPSRLINDFIAIGGIGGALVNSAFVGLFGLFGKTVVNVLPIIAGVYLAGRFMNKEFKGYIIIALFGTALGPVVSFLAFEFGLTGIWAALGGVGLGLITGFFLPALAVSMLHLHQGYNLYNMGLTCGFFGLFVASFIKLTGHSFQGQLEWYSEPHLVLQLMIPVLSVALIILGIVSDSKNAFKSFRKIQKIPGRLPSDFMAMESMEGSLINCGSIGLLGTIYVVAVGADFNGPVIGGLLTIMGFATFGTNIKNSWPVVTGVVICAFIFGMDLSSPGTILAAIFVTTLGPLAGEFGWRVGILAGMIHLAMVMQTGSWHGGMNLYNNGFAGGLTASIIVAVIQWYRTNKTEVKNTFRSGK